MNKFSWMCLLFCPYYYSGYGKMKWGLAIATLGTFPLFGLISHIYFATRARTDLPVGEQPFSWSKAIVTFIYAYTLYALALLAFNPNGERDALLGVQVGNNITETFPHCESDFSISGAKEALKENMEMLSIVAGGNVSIASMEEVEQIGYDPENDETYGVRYCKAIASLNTGDLLMINFAIYDRGDDTYQFEVEYEPLPVRGGNR